MERSQGKKKEVYAEEKRGKEEVEKTRRSIKIGVWNGARLVLTHSKGI